MIVAVEQSRHQQLTGAVYDPGTLYQRAVGHIPGLADGIACDMDEGVSDDWHASARQEGAVGEEGLVHIMSCGRSALDL